MNNDFKDFLLSRGLLSADQINAAQKEAEISGAALPETLFKMGMLSAATLRAAQAHTLGIESVDLKTAAIQPQALEIISREQAQKWKVMPLALKESAEFYEFSVAMAQTDNVQFLDKLTAAVEKLLQKPCHLQVFFASPADIARAISEHYGHSLSFEQILEDLEKEGDDESAIARLVDAFLVDAVFNGASDIHFEPEAGFLRVRYRIDGLLQQARVLHLSRWQALAVRLKVLAGMDIAESRAPQDGRMSCHVLGRNVDFRVSSMPTLHGENMVLRVLDRSKSVLTLAELGLNEKQTKVLNRLLAKPTGILLVVGPTGCGKTTTLYALLSHIHNAHIHIMTLEDPVEYPMPFLRQISVGEASKLDFVDGVRAILRHDPDVILIGEIRDSETAQMAFRAAMTGHQVFSTLHSNSALAALPRLFDLGLPADILSTHLNGIIAQRLVRQLCPHCKKPRKVGETLAAELNAVLSEKSFSPDSEIFEPKGCAKCRQGYLSRIAIMEILMMNEALESAIAERKPRHILAQIAAHSGFTTLLEDGLAQVLGGKTSLAELARVLDLGFLTGQ